MDENTQSQGPTGSDMPSGDSGDVEKNKVMAMLSYIGILVLVPLLAAKDSKFAKFHAKQGLVLLIAWIINGVIYVIPFIGWIVGTIIWIFLAIMAIMGIVYSLSGKYWKMPILGQFAEKFNI